MAQTEPSLVCAKFCWRYLSNGYIESMQQTEKKGRVPGFWIALLVMILLTGGVLVAYNYMLFRKDMLAKARNIPPIKELPEFQLTANDGQLFTKSDMQGKVWLANFIFTRCPGPCLTLSGRMAEWQKKIADMPDVGLLSVTVDPDYDTPQILNEYGQRFGAQPDKWRFLTGNPEPLLDLIRKGFMLTVAEQKDPQLIETEGSIIHSTRVVLIDQNAMIRGYYDTESPEAMEKLSGDIEHLLDQYGGDKEVAE